MVDLRLALYQPEIAQNAGAIFRMASVIGLTVDLIGPTGFVMTDKKLKRVAMDYLDTVNVCSHHSWESYLVFRASLRKPLGRVLLLTTSGDCTYSDFSFQEGDTLLVGQETSGVPARIHEYVDARLRVPMVVGQRSLNVVVAAAMVVGEAFRQTGVWGNL